MGKAMQGGTALRNLKCVRLKSRVGICQRDLVQGAYLRQTALQLRYAKVAELKKTLRVEQVAKECKRT